MASGSWPQGLDLVEDHRQALQVGVEGGWLGIHRGLRDVINDTTMNALIDLEAKQYQSEFSEKSTIIQVYCYV